MIDISPVLLWLLVGLLCIAIEFTHLPGIGLLFLGLAGLCNASLLQFYPELSSYQFASFGVMAFGWMVVLWLPLKRYLYKSTKHSVILELVGREVEVLKVPTGSGLMQVKWSGTIMNAKLEQALSEQTLVVVKIGDKLIVQAVQGNILVCTKQKL